jgi:polysaccharide pyruvyl transferase WcaK-like protein
MSPLVSAWVGRGNFGDELLSYGLRLELYQASAVSSVSYYEAGREAVYRASDDAPLMVCNVAGQSRWLRLYKRYTQSCTGYDSLFFGGGSVLHSGNSIAWKHDLLRRFRRARSSASLLSAAVGVSLGPFPDIQAERQAQAFLAELDVVHCRDAISADFARQVGGGLEVIEGRDLAFSVRVLRPELFVASKQQGRVGASFILSPKLGEEQQREQFAKMLALLDYLTAAGHQVLLASLYSGDKYADNCLHQRLREAARQPELIELHDYIGDVRATAGKIASCDFYLSMRLHGVITAYLSGTPFFALNRHPKVREFCAAVLGEQADTCQGDLTLAVPELLERLEMALQCAQVQPRYEPLSDSRYADSSMALAARLRSIV